MTAYLDPRDMDFADCYPILWGMRRTHPLRVRRWEAAQQRYRSFADRFIRPLALQVDARAGMDPDYLCWDFCRRAAEERLFSVMVPPMFGGQGGDLMEMVIMFEELCAACTGLANVVAAHYLGYSGLAAGLNLDLLGRISDEIVAGEKRGEPVMMSAAHTEPTAGSDVEDEEMMPMARVATTAKKTDGGWLINGQKIFISDGHFATYHMVTAYRDKKDPLFSGLGVIVKTGQQGFELLKHERKMGQRACPASTLVFEDCFVPDNMVIAAERRFFERILFVLGASRIGVAAIAAGCARGAFEQAVKIAQAHRRRGRYLVDEQWVQQILADMAANVMIGRALALSAAFSEADNGMMTLLGNPLLGLLQNIIPSAVLLSSPYQKVIRSRLMSRIMNASLEKIEIRRRQRNQAHSSAAKWVAADLAMQNADLALEIAGAAGLVQESGVEKFFRDAKLLQIYEGTNQINRKHLWDSLIARSTTM